jgi:catechol 2,3-dioxygenase
MAIHPDTSVGTVRLTVADLTRSRTFYQQVLGLKAAEREDGSLALGPAGGDTLVEVVAEPAARPPARGATGLFHQAILVPSRHELALALRRIAEARWPLSGASDHLVSEALYLSDPDGNGIEIYRDRPREEWPHSNGDLQMSTLPLDLDDVLGELRSADHRAEQAASGTRMGHVHLKVANLDDAERFYSGLLGFDVTVRGYPGALFVSAGGYHHHIGLNTWHSQGGSPPPPNSIGLRSFEVDLPSEEELEQVLGRVEDAGVGIERRNGAALVHDPSGNGVLLRVR